MGEDLLQQAAEVNLLPQENRRRKQHTHARRWL